jgi:hypothetical protein
MAGTDWRGELDGWLGPFLAALNHEKRRRWAPAYLQGLLGPDGRKSVQPLAARLGLGGHDQLQHFVTSPAWDDAPLRRALAAKAAALVGGPDAVLVVDDTALPKQGKLSVGVARQYRGRLGKKANCQVLVSLTLARGEVPVPVGLRLFLPDEWVADPDRCARAGVPDEHRRAEAKTAVALAEVDRVLAAGARFGAVLADAGYGTGAAFRRGLSARGLVWAVGLLKTQNVYPAAVALRWPAARTGRPRRHPACRARPRPRPGPCWRAPRGVGSAGGAAPRGRRRPRSPPCGCARPKGRSSGTAGTCPGTRSGWWASAAPPASASTTSPTRRRRRRSGSWRRPSRRAGRAGRPTSSSRRSWGSTTSKGDRGPGCTGTRCWR